MNRLNSRSAGFAIVAVLAAAVFVRLGTWQLDRLGERRAQNAERQALASLPLLDLADTAALPPVDSLLWRRVRLTGAWDFENEIVIRGRAALGSPGVHVVTPLQLEGGSIVLVLRGWLPAADGLSADLGSARPAPDADARSRIARVTGRLVPGAPSSVVAPRRLHFESGEHVVLGSLDLEAAERELHEPVFGAWLLPDSALHAGGAVEPRLVEAPPPSDGPHLMYAIQWFGFATIAIAGGAVYVLNRGRSNLERRDL